MLTEQEAQAIVNQAEMGDVLRITYSKDVSVFGLDVFLSPAARGALSIERDVFKALRRVVEAREWGDTSNVFEVVVGPRYNKEMIFVHGFPIESIELIEASEPFDIRQWNPYSP